MDRQTSVLVFSIWIVLNACATVHVNDTTVQSLDLPAPAVHRRPWRVGVFLPEEFRTATPETSNEFLGETYIYRHHLGSALESVILQVMDGSFAGWTQLDKFPRPPDKLGGLDAIIVPGAPVMDSAIDMQSSLSSYRQSMEIALSVYGPSGEVLGHAKARGAISDGLHRQETIDQAMLRSVASDWLRLTQENPLFGPLNAAQDRQPATPASPPRRHVVAMRIDAGLGTDDRFEEMLALCIRPAEAEKAGFAQGADAAAVRDATFPWLEPKLGEKDVHAYHNRLMNPLARQRLQEQAVSHLMLFSVSEEPSVEDNHLLCGAGVGGGACVGNYKKTLRYSLNLSIWDVAGSRFIRDHKIDVTRTLGVLGILLPIPYFSRNGAEVCENLKKYMDVSLGAAP